MVTRLRNADERHLAVEQTVHVFLDVVVPDDRLIALEHGDAAAGFPQEILRRAADDETLPDHRIELPCPAISRAIGQRFLLQAPTRNVIDDEVVLAGLGRGKAAPGEGGFGRWVK